MWKNERIRTHNRMIFDHANAYVYFFYNMYIEITVHKWICVCVCVSNQRYVYSVDFTIDFDELLNIKLKIKFCIKEKL